MAKRQELLKTNYRSIYKKCKGEIPKDDQGRSYDIHHIDGDYLNNSPDNLLAVAINEHYKIHEQQEDWAACRAIAMRLNLDPATVSHIAQQDAQKRVNEGTHHFLDGSIAKRTNERRLADGTHNFLDGENNKKIQLNRLENGTHPFLTINKKRKDEGDIVSSKRQKQKLADGTHPFLDKDLYKKLIAEGKHAGSKVFATLHICPHCKKQGKGAIMFRHHYDNCKQNKAK